MPGTNQKNHEVKKSSKNCFCINEAVKCEKSIWKKYQQDFYGKKLIKAVNYFDETHQRKERGDKNWIKEKKPSKPAEKNPWADFFLIQPCV